MTIDRCPHCRSECYGLVGSTSHDKPQGYYVVGCTNCGVRGPEFTDPDTRTEEAILAWNAIAGAATESERLRSALIVSDGIVQELRSRYATACSERQSATEMIVDLIDALVVEKTSHEERYCTACGYRWCAEQPATDKVHGEGCIVEKAECLLRAKGVQL